MLFRSGEGGSEATGGGATLTVAPRGGAGAFTFTCPSAMSSGAVTLVMEKSAYVLPENETVKREGVRKIIVGTSDGPQLFVLSADPASPGFSFSSLRTARGLRVQLAPPAGSSPAVLLSVNLSLETDAAAALLRNAKDFEAEGKLGLAAMAYERVALVFHYLPDFRKQGEAGALRILERGKADLEAGKEAARNGRQFGSAPDLDRATALLDPLVAAYGEHPIGAMAAEKKAEVEADRVKVRGLDVAERTEKLYKRAADLALAGQPALQLPLLEEILRIAPADNDERLQVEQQIGAVRGKVEEERTALYGVKR